MDNVDKSVNKCDYLCESVDKFYSLCGKQKAQTGNQVWDPNKLIFSYQKIRVQETFRDGQGMLAEIPDTA